MITFIFMFALAVGVAFLKANASPAYRFRFSGQHPIVPDDYDISSVSRLDEYSKHESEIHRLCTDLRNSRSAYDKSKADYEQFMKTDPIYSILIPIFIFICFARPFSFLTKLLPYAIGFIAGSFFFRDNLHIQSYEEADIYDPRPSISYDTVNDFLDYWKDEFTRTIIPTNERIDQISKMLKRARDFRGILVFAAIASAGAFFF